MLLETKRRTNDPPKLSSGPYSRRRSIVAVRHHAHVLIERRLHQRPSVFALPDILFGTTISDEILVEFLSLE